MPICFLCPYESFAGKVFSFGWGHLWFSVSVSTLRIQGSGPEGMRVGADSFTAQFQIPDRMMG